MNFASIASSGFAAKGSYNLQPVRAKITERDDSYYRRNISFADSKTIEAEQNRQVLERRLSSICRNIKKAFLSYCFA